MDYVLPGVIEGAGAYLRAKGLRIDARWSVRADWMPDQPGWDGVVAHLINMEGAKRKMEALGLPEVHLSGWLGSDAAVRVQGDFAGYGKLVVDEFRRLGLHRVVGLMPGSGSLARDFDHSVRIATEQAGLDFIRLPGWRDDLPWDDALKRLGDETETVRRPFGLFMPHAGMAFSLMDEFAGRGLRIPEEVAIIVIDKDVQRTAELAPIPLTAVVPDFWQQGYEAARLVHRMIGGEWLGNHVAQVAPLGLVRRASTGEVTSRDPVVAKVLHLIRENSAAMAPGSSVSLQACDRGAQGRQGVRPPGHPLRHPDARLHGRRIFHQREDARAAGCQPPSELSLVGQRRTRQFALPRHPVAERGGFQFRPPGALPAEHCGDGRLRRTRRHGSGLHAGLAVLRQQ